MNLCVKSEPASLLSSSVFIDDGEYELEKVIKLAKPDDSSLQLFPIDQVLIPNICQAILKEHPEFKQELVDNPFEKKSDDGSAPKMIVLTMPPVDEDRKKDLLDMVNALHKDCEKRMEFEYTVFSASGGAAAITLPKETKEETKKEFEDTYKSFVDLAGKYKENKTKEIEDAYSRWCETNEGNERKEKEEEEAKGQDAVYKMSLEDMTLEN